MRSDPREAALAVVQVFCDSRIPQEHRGEIRLGCSRRGNSITLVERRPPWDPELVGNNWLSMKVAQLRYDTSSKLWSLFCLDRNGRRWPYDHVGPSPSVDPLLAEIAADPTGILWG